MSSNVGTLASPRRRKDGTLTVSTTVTLPVELAMRLKAHNAASCPEKRQSDIICEALERYLGVEAETEASASKRSRRATSAQPPTKVLDRGLRLGHNQLRANK